MKKILKFLTVGATNTLIDFAILNLLIQLTPLSLLWSNSISFSVAVINSYLLNKYWTFQDRKPIYLTQFSLFFVISLVGLGLSNLILHFGTKAIIFLWPDLTFTWQYNLAKMASAVIVLVWNFAAYQYWVFYDRKK
ncbi:GtrA family protein [Patescibacteria group bacterium]|nr:GtrA family protein [Patescibacteria group bacterium]